MKPASVVTPDKRRKSALVSMDEFLSKQNYLLSDSKTGKKDFQRMQTEKSEKSNKSGGGFKKTVTMKGIRAPSSDKLSGMSEGDC